MSLECVRYLKYTVHMYQLLMQINLRGIIMKLSAPKKIVFWIAIVIAIAAVLMALGVFSISFISAVWVAIIAFVLLALGNVLKGF